jgi:type I restriction enzyme M protein
VLMLDARNIFARCRARSAISVPSSRRTSPPSSGSIAASRTASSSSSNPIWRRRSQTAKAASGRISAFEDALDKLVALIETFAKLKRENDPLAEPWAELYGTRRTATEDIRAFHKETEVQATAWPAAGRVNADLNAADRCRDLTKQIDLAAKLAGRVIDIAVKDLAARNSEAWDNGDVNRARKALDAKRADAVEALRLARYFVRQADWLQERFPEAKLRDVEGLVKLVDLATITANNDWSLAPGRYVGVAPEEQEDDFDFEERLRAIHIDLKGLNEEAAELAAQIARNFEELGA